MAFAFESEEDLFPIYEDTKTPFFDKVGGEESLFSYDVADESREFIEQDERSLNHFVFVKEEDAHSFFPVKEEMPQQPSPPRQPSPTTNQFYSLKEEFPQPPQQAYANLSPTGSPRNFGSQNIYTLQVPQIHAHQGTGGRRFSNPPMYTLGNFSNVTLPQPQIQQVQQQYQPQSPQISPQIAPQFQFQTSPIQPFSPQNHHFQQEFQPVQFSRYNKDYDVRGYTNDHSGSSLSYSSSGTYSTEEDSSHTEEPNFCDDYEQSDEQKIIEIASKFTLPSSKSPIIEAMIFCAVHNWGIHIIHNNPDTVEERAKVILLVKNFGTYCTLSRMICSKRHPTNNEGARIKALRRWFVKFPKKKERKSRESFLLEVKADHAQKVYDMIQRHLHDA